MATLFYFNESGIVTGVVYPNGTVIGTTKNAVKFVPIEEPAEVIKMLNAWTSGTLEMTEDNIVKISDEDTRKSDAIKDVEEIIADLQKSKEGLLDRVLEQAAAKFLLDNPRVAKELGINIYR
jgi:hypothetical protein